MKTTDLQYIKDTHEKAKRVISSCTSPDHYISAKKYINLLESQYREKFNLDQLFIEKDDWDLCNDTIKDLKISLVAKKLTINLKVEKHVAMLDDEFKKQIMYSMNRGGWGPENFKDAMPLIEKYIIEKINAK
jgi:hypothetical protein